MSANIPEEPEEKVSSDRLDQAINLFLDYSRKAWQHILAYVLISILVGLAGVGLALSSVYAGDGNKWLQQKLGLWLLIAIPAAFALIAWLTSRFFHGVQGSGVPQTIAAINDPEDQKKNNLLSLRNLFGKIILLLGGFFSGASIGRGGPTVQIGASISHAFYGYGPFRTAEHRRMLILAGGAAGIAVAFNAPLAGIMFAFEELNKKRSFRIAIPVLFAVIIACLTSLALLGNYTYFGRTQLQFDIFRHFHAIFICAGIGGLAGGLFSLFIQKFTVFIPERTRSSIHRHPYVFAAVCGLIITILGLATDGLTFGSGYQPTRMVLDADSSLLSWYYGIARLVATIVTALSGIPAGLFAPSLSVGAGLGDNVSALFPGIAPHGVIIILAMTAYLSGVTRAPFTSFLMTMEMTGSYHMFMPLLVTAWVAAIVSRFVSPSPLYHALAERYVYSRPHQKNKTPESDNNRRRD